MKDLKTVARPAMVLIVDDAIAGKLRLEGLEVLGLSGLRSRLVRLESDASGQSLALPDLSLLGACLSDEGMAALEADAGYLALLNAQDLPLRALGEAPDHADIAAAAWGLMVDRLEKTRRDAAMERRAAAELRRTHMQVQDDHAELETWIWDQLAPKYSVVRHWPATADTVALGEAGGALLQPLPAPFRGFGAVDVQIAEDAPAGTLTLTLLRPGGAPFEGATTSATVCQGDNGPFRLTLPRAGSGQPEDAVLSLTFTPEEAGKTLPLQLAPVTPFPDVSAVQDGVALGRPLAITVYRTLPRMPAPPLHDTRRPVPADGTTYLLRPAQLEDPQLLPYFRRNMPPRFRDYPDAPKVELRRNEDNVLVQPSIARPVVAMLPGVPVEGLRQISAIIQLARHDTMPVAFAIGAAPAGLIRSARKALARVGDWVHLLPGEWGHAWYEAEEPMEGHVDLFLATAMPNMPFNTNAEALFHGFRMTGRAKPQADTAE
ncbi:DUF6212 domain-containing protein [Oceanibium sediminis]|uniref:DUF6212 domain-containing protein n=1 Tax=Oceanibium sediminis TaxID=2026339 RepID=UPI000DD407B7|nr:DUF6212 domain-containing protein [Oceanibium sediminis]